jgi:hypothetical protein
LSSVHARAICVGMCPLSVAIPFTATEVRRSRVLAFVTKNDPRP